MRHPVSRSARWATSVGAVALFAALYLLIAPPARRWVAQHVAAPALSATVPAGAPVRVEARDSPPGALVTDGTTTRAAYSVPLGVLFFLPALLLVAVAPLRPAWAILAGVLLVLGVIDLAVVAAGIRWGGGWFAVHAFMDGYVIRPASIAVPLVLLYRDRRVATQAQSEA